MSGEPVVVRAAGPVAHVFGADTASASLTTTMPERVKVLALSPEGHLAIGYERELTVLQLTAHRGRPETD
jgi:hypothetical protein